MHSKNIKTKSEKKEIKVVNKPTSQKSSQKKVSERIEFRSNGYPSNSQTLPNAVLLV